MNEIKNRFRQRILIVFLITIAFLASSAAIPLRAGSQVSERALTIGFVGEVETANPFLGYSDTSEFYYSMIYDCLTSLDENLEIRPNLASSWWSMDGFTASLLGQDFSVFDDNPNASDWPQGSIWEFNITQRIYWSDGMPFTADDVEWTINQQILDCYHIFWKYQSYTRWIYHAEAVNDNKVRIFFSDPFGTEAPMPVTWGDSMFFPILPRHQFEEKSVAYLAIELNLVPPVGTGPFMAIDNTYDEILEQEAINLLRNPYYNFWDNGIHGGLGASDEKLTEIDRLKIKFYSEETALEHAIRSGEIDVGEIGTNKYVVWGTDSTLPERLNTVSLLDPRGVSKSIGLNANPNSLTHPLDPALNPLRLDPAVQRAVALATNKSYFVNHIFHGMATEGVGLISNVWEDWYFEPSNELSTFYIYDPTDVELFNYSKPLCNAMDFNLTLANQILDAAGYEWSGEVGNSPRYATSLAGERLNSTYGIPVEDLIDLELSFEIAISEWIDEDRLIAEHLQNEWMKIGVDGEPNYMDKATWTERIFTYAFDVQLTTWSGTPDPSYLLYIPTSYALYGWNEFGTSNAEYDSMFLNQTIAMGYNERKHWVDECIKWQYLSGSIITTVYPQTCYAYNNGAWTNWGNWTEHPGFAIGRAYCAVNPLVFSLEFNEEYVETAKEKSFISQYWWAIGITAAVIVAIIAFVILSKKKSSPKEPLT